MNACYNIQGSGNIWSSSGPGDNASTPHGHAIFDSLENQMAQFQAQNDTLMEEIRKNFILPRDQSAEAFLRDHKALPEILVGSLPALRASFGDAAVLTLDAHLDEAGSRTAYARVVWPGSLDSAKEALARFDEAWWMQRVQSAFGRLTFTYELV